MPGKFTRLDSKFNLVSAFWVPGVSDSTETGFLVSGDDGIYFTTSPKYKIKDRNESLASFARAFNGQDILRLPVMLGFTEDGPYTLCHLLRVASPGLHTPKTGESVESTKYRAGVCISGMHLQDADHELLTSARYTFTSLHDWLPKASTETWENDHIVLKIPQNEKTIVDTEVPNNGIRVRLKLFAELTTNDSDGTRAMRSVPYLEIETPTPKSLSWYLDVGNRLENLLSLLIGGSLALETLFVYGEHDDSGHVICERPRHVEAFNPFDCIRCSPSQIAKCLTTWLDQPQEFLSVENLALDVLRKGKLFYETEFLSLAQALEGFHRATSSPSPIDKGTLKRIRRAYNILLTQEKVEASLAEKLCGAMAHANEPAFASRLTELCGRLSDTVLIKMGITVESFVREIVNTRNYYTHAGGKLTSKRMRLPLMGSPVFYMNQRMRALLRGVLLLNLGFSESEISSLLVREATRWR